MTHMEVLSDQVPPPSFSSLVSSHITYHPIPYSKQKAFKKYFIFVCVNASVYMYMEVRGQLAVLSFYHVRQRDQTLVVRLGIKCLDPIKAIILFYYA